MLKFGGIILAAGLVTLWPAQAWSQQKEVVSNSIAVSGDEATLLLEFDDDTRFELSFREGEVMIDGTVVGLFARGDELASSWRALLGRAVALSDGPLAEALIEWTPPDDVPDRSSELATRIDRALEAALTVDVAEAEPEEEPAVTALDTAIDRSILQTLLLGQSERLGELGEALEDLALTGVRVHVGEDVVVEEGEVVDATLVVVDGDLDVYGRVEGNVVVAGGSLRLRDDSRVTGDVRLADSRLYRDGGVVEGRVRRVDEETPEVDDLRIELRRELEREIESAVSARVRRDIERDRSFFRPLRHIGWGLGGIMQNLITFVILAAVALGVVHFIPDRLQVAASAARDAPGRSAMVGLASAFLAFPAWLLGIVLLCVSLIGIPFLIAWVPLFPLVVAAAAGLGYLAMAKNVGEWLADQHYQGFDWLERSNIRQVVVAGLGVLMAAFVGSNVVRMAGPWLGFLQGLFATVGVIATLVAITIGFGAVVLTRGGRRSDLAYAEDFSFRDSMWGGWSRRGFRYGAADDAATADVMDEVDAVMEEAADAADEAARAVDEAAEAVDDTATDAGEDEPEDK